MVAPSGKERGLVVAMTGARAVPADGAGRSDRRIRLRDGRWLGFAEYGDPDGVPLFAFHGTPGSRLMVEPAHGPARERGVRLIAPDRPGFGLSSRKAGRRIGDWPEDVAELADALGFPRFGVVGVSGGGPYALACAWRIPERLSVVASVSGVAPMVGAGGMPKLQGQDHVALELVRYAPWLRWPLMALGGFAWRRSAERLYRRLNALCPPADRAVLERPEVARALITGVREAFREGSRGAADELDLFIRPWGFPLEQIALPVLVWHGARDTLVPCVAAERLARSIPDCRVETIRGGGHYLVYDMLDELLSALRREIERGRSGAVGQESGAKAAGAVIGGRVGAAS